MRRLLPDLFCALLLVLVGAVAARPLLSAKAVVTGAGDWDAHVFRVLDLRERGLASWTNEWAGGLPLWSSYQFAPHWLTATLSGQGPERVSRTMAHEQALLVMVLPVVVFGVAWLWRVGRFPALTAGFLTLALDSRTQTVANFSELWGLVLLVALLGGLGASAYRPLGLLLAWLVGVSWIVHPLAFVGGTFAFVSAALSLPAAQHSSSQRRGVQDQPQRVGRRRRKATVSALLGNPGSAPACRVAWIAFGMVLIGVGSAGFWLPVVDSARPAYEHPYFTSAQFERLLVDLTLHSFAPGTWLWPGVALALLVLLAIRTNPHRAHARYLLGVTLLICLVTLLSVLGFGPRLLLAAQLPRLLALVPLLTAMTAALALAAVPVLFAERARAGGHPEARPVRSGRPTPENEYTPLSAPGKAAHRRFQSRPAADGWPFSVLLVAGTAGVALSAAWSSPYQRVVTDGPERPLTGLTGWLRTQRPTVLGGRIAVAPDLVAEPSAFAKGKGWYTSSYSGREWSLLGPPLRMMLLEGFGDPPTRSALLTAMAVEDAVVPAGRRPPIADPVTGTPQEWQRVATFDGLDLLKLPWSAPVAFAAPRAAIALLLTPDLPYLTLPEAVLRDDLVRRYARLALAPASPRAELRGRTADTLWLELDSRPPSPVDTLMVSVNWDRHWRATVNGLPAVVRRGGPHFLAVDLGAAAPESGPVQVIVTHRTNEAGTLRLLTAAGALLAAALTLAHWVMTTRADSVE